MHVDWSRVDLRVVAPGEKRMVRLIRVVPDQLITREERAPALVEDGCAVADPGRDIAKLAVIERHHATGNVGLAFVRGFGLIRGALASSVAHDSHNLIVVGTDDRDMRCAARAVVAMQGGFAVADDGQVLARLPLPIAGLMSTLPLAQVRDQLERIEAQARALGCTLDAPFMALSFLALPVIPELKLTDKGLVDVKRFDLVSNWVD
jgi:adenine deaminase